MALADTVPVSVKVALPPTSRLTVTLMLPLPEAGQLLPGVAAQVHVAPEIVAGRASATVAPVTSLGPLLDATIVYVIGLPGV